jgi:hypothetical protein
VYKHVAGVLKSLRRSDKIFFHEKDVGRRECGCNKNADARFGERLNKGRNDAGGFRLFITQDSYAAISRLLLNVIRRHELRTDDGKILVGPHDKAHLSLCEDGRELGKLGKLADGEFLVQQKKFQFVIQ